MVRLYIADVSTLDIERALTEVSDYRRQKALRCPDDEKCRCSLGAELLLYRALGAPVEYALGDNGKPYIDGGAHFSLSHSGKYAVCAVSDCEIGVDIEYPRENTARLAKRFFTASENARLAASDAPDVEFCRIWVVKESYIKATGMGFKTPLPSFEAARRIGEYSTLQLEHDGYHIAVCAKCESIGDIKVYDEEII